MIIFFSGMQIVQVDAGERSSKPAHYSSVECEVPCLRVVLVGHFGSVVDLEIYHPLCCCARLLNR